MGVLDAGQEGVVKAIGAVQEAGDVRLGEDGVEDMGVVYHGNYLLF